GHTHSAIDVARDIRAARRWSEGNAADEVASVAVETYGPGYDIVKEMHPGTPYEAKFSLAYCVAASLAYGGAPLSVFSTDTVSGGAVHDPAITALLGRTTVTVADDLT